MGFFDSLFGSNKPVAAPTPAQIQINIPQATVEISSAKSVAALNDIIRKYGNVNHPHIHFCIAVRALLLDQKDIAKKFYVSGASFGFIYPSQYYDTIFSDSMGECLTHLITQFSFEIDSLENGEAFDSSIKLAYVFLSKCISLYPDKAYDSYRARAMLMQEEDAMNLTLKLGMFVMKDPFIIADYYRASTGYNNDPSTKSDCVQSARRIHANLGDVGVGGKDADEYTAQEITEFGLRRHAALFKVLEEEYKEGKFNTSKAALERLFV